MAHAKVSNFEVLTRIACGQATERIYRELKVSKDRIRNLRVNFPKVWTGNISCNQVRPCSNCIHSHFQTEDDRKNVRNNGCDSIECDYSYDGQPIIRPTDISTDRHTDRPTCRPTDKHDGIIHDKIGTKYDPDYDLVQQLSEKIKELEVKNNEILELKQQLTDRPTDTPTDRHTDRPTDIILTYFNPEQKEAFFEWLNVVSFQSNPLFVHYRKYGNRGTFEQALNLFLIFIQSQFKGDHKIE